MRMKTIGTLMIGNNRFQAYPNHSRLLSYECVHWSESRAVRTHSLNSDDRVFVKHFVRNRR